MTTDPFKNTVFNNEVKNGFLLQQEGKISQAKLIYQNVLASDPYNFNALQLVGLIELEDKNFEIAINFLKRAIKVDPTITNAQINIANAYISIGNYEEAFNHYSNALKINPQLSQPHYGIGLCFDNRREWDSAIKNYIHAIELDSNFIDAYLNLGACLEEKKMWETAVESYDHAIAINPSFSMAYNNRGNALKELLRFDEAIESFRKAISTNPSYGLAFSNLGVLYRELGFINKALECFNSALTVDPKNKSVIFNKSLTLLVSGDLKNGFREYECRWESKNLQKYKRHYQKPLWLGEESLSDKTIFIYSEQGLGDIIQFCRYIEMVSDLGARIVLEIPSSLTELINSLKGVSQIITSGEDIPYYDFQCPIMSLPLAFKTDIKSIPARIPYLSCPKEKKLYWHKRFGKQSKFRVGLVWSGGFRPNQPEFLTTNSRRNIPLEKLASLKHPEVEFYSLQKGVPAESELHSLLEIGWDGPNILDYTNELVDFTDTAAMIENLDLIISVDTSVAHLAGALGKPVWLLNRYDTCWRWLLNRNDSPWYPSFKLYRQEKYGDWDNVIQRVKLDLITALSTNIY